MFFKKTTKNYYNKLESTRKLLKKYKIVLQPLKKTTKNYWQQLSTKKIWVMKNYKVA